MGRPVDPEFQPSERLFYRFEGPYAVGSSPSGLGVRSPDFSVNREKHGGLPEFVLIPNWLTWGIAQFAVKSIPNAIASDGGVVYTWPLHHTPEEENYFHSEITTLKSGVRCTKSSQVNDIVKKEFRQMLAEQMLVVKAFEGDDF